MPVDPHLVVEMRSRREPGRTNVGDGLRLPNAVANLQAAGKARDMGIRCLVAEIMSDADILPIAPLLSDELHNARARRGDREP
jgi:hypothetical protein